MSYEPIYNITNKTADGFAVSFRLKKKGATEPSPIPKLPLYGYRFTFNLSKFGLGLLNSKVTVDLLDDELDTFYNLFNNNLRNNIGLEIIHEDIGELFWGFADFQQLERILFEDNKRGIRVVFYNPSSLMQNIGYYTPPIQAELETSLGIISDGVQTNLIWFADYFVNVAFRDYQNAVNTSLIHRWIPQRSRFTGAMMPAEARFNEMAFSRLAFEDENITVADTMGIISRTFFFRYGWSITHQSPAVVQLDTGFDEDKYDLRQLKTPKIDVSTRTVDGFFIYDIDADNDIELPIIQKNRLQRQVRALDVPPYISTTYSRVGADGLIVPAQQASRTIENPNPDFTDPFLFGTYVAEQSPFNSFTDTGTSQVIALTVSGTNSVLTNANGYLDFTAFPNEFAQSSASMNARLHMNIRKDIQKNIKAVYKGILDPLIPHKTDFDDNAYIIVRGEYDLLRGETIIQESISLFKTQ